MKIGRGSEHLGKGIEYETAEIESLADKSRLLLVSRTTGVTIISLALLAGVASFVEEVLPAMSNSLTVILVSGQRESL